MTMYDVKFYGVNWYYRIGGDMLIMSPSVAIYNRSPVNARFEVTLLKQFGSKKDVLEIQYVMGEKEYVTLYEPTMYLDNGEWKETDDRRVPQKFLETYKTFCCRAEEDKRAREETTKSKSIYAIKFYGMIEWVGITHPRVAIALSSKNMDGCNSYTDKPVYFIACILDRFKGNKNVIKLIFDEGVDYIPLFNPKMHYDVKEEKWIECEESPIPGKILKCYIKHLQK